MILVNRGSLSAVECASNEVSRYTCNAVLVTKDKTIATDGHRMAIITHPTINAENKDFPNIDGFTATPRPTNGWKRLISIDTMKAVAKSLPRKSTIPVLLNAAINATGQIATTDLDLPTVRQAVEVSGQFPEYERAIPTGAPQAVVSLDVNLLEGILRSIKAVKSADRGTVTVRIAVYGYGKPVRFDAHCVDNGQDALYVLMPVRGCDGVPDLPAAA
jgi:DNA polymerase III sliding clamp (beta) subunit (PCNA family)